ncbi:hypothetical protein [Pelagerythrobacter sp.]|uniref:hypothetical protein n=1 Tax=Pelagerythrobacter sp. TaxID=2800702 RepID=UPI0035B4A107
MNDTTARRRGQPLAVLVCLLVVWIAGRVMMWQSPFPPVAEALEPLVSLVDARAADTAPSQPPAVVLERGLVVSGSAMPQKAAASLDRLLPVREAGAAAGLQSFHSGEVMAGHHLLWLAATASLPIPAELTTQFGSAAPRQRRGSASGAERGVAALARKDRWSVDSWLLLRPNASGRSLAGAGPASYGASQAGAVVRYRLAPGSTHRPTAYARVSQALAGGRESELAAGFAARPVPGVPVSVHAEVRAVRSAAGRARLRPAAFAVTELPPARLPFALRGEAYLQAGYVGGDFATAFVDGQARADREVARFDLGTLRAGAGVWGGAQKGAARLDVGPSAALHLDLGVAPARLAVDYRVRVAGTAMPDTGVALTLSTGF